MAKEEEKCVCGGPGVGEGGKKRVIFPCAGASKTGQMTNHARVRLAMEGYGIMACTAGIPIRAPATMEKVEKGEELVAIDRCPVACARKVLEQQNLKVGQHVIVTSLGIKKTGELIPKEEEIEQVVEAVWRGVGA
ncbi:MAG: putative zinc-binding protein [Methanomicrobiales archaeon]|nr:putative zinc-binding protein [Methanomicrobiales archaeon]